MIRHIPIADRCGQRRVFVLGIALVAFACVAFIPATPHIAVLVILFSPVGISTALVSSIALFNR